MNKYDDITNYLSTEPNIKNDFDYLTGYITVFLYKNANREKLDDFYNKIPSIFDRIFGISAKTRNSKTVVKSVVDLLINEKTTFEEFDTLLHLLLPGVEENRGSNMPNVMTINYNLSNLNNFKNLFHSVNLPPDLVPNYKIPVSIISRSVNALITEKKQDYLYSILEIFKVLSVPPEYQKSEIDSGFLRLSIFEYFIVVLLISIKEYSSYSLSSSYSYNPYSKHKINLPKINKNFTELRKNTTIKRPLSEKTKENLFSIDLNKSLIYNFYLILFNNLLTHFSQSRYINDHLKLRFMVAAVETIWLSDYFIIPSSIYLSKNSLEIYSYFFRQESNLYNSNNLYFTPPNIIMLDCLQNLVISLQSGGNLFREQVVNGNTNNGNRYYSLEKDGLLFTLQKPLFYFFKTSFLRYSEIYSANSEVYLSDIAKIWFIYITPWMQVDRGTQLQNQSNTTQSQNYGYNNYNTNYSKGNTFDDVVREYIHMNLLFYTELLNDYILAFSSLNVLNKNELSLLNKVLDLYKMRDGEIINDYVSVRLLEDLSQGKIYNYSSLIEVDHHVKYIGSIKRNLFPFAASENQKFTSSIVNNISNWIYNLENKNEVLNDEIANFLKTLKESQIILKTLYNIQENLKDNIEQSNQKNFLQDSNNIYFKKDYEAVFQGNQWSKKLSNEENTILYYIFLYIAYLIDYGRGIPTRYDRKGNKELPITNLRFLCNYYNLISAIIFILIVYLLIRLIVGLIVPS